LVISHLSLNSAALALFNRSELYLCADGFAGVFVFAGVLGVYTQVRSAHNFFFKISGDDFRS
jgi:hypothetical protein